MLHGTRARIDFELRGKGRKTERIRRGGFMRAYLETGFVWRSCGCGKFSSAGGAGGAR